MADTRRLNIYPAIGTLRRLAVLSVTLFASGCASLPSSGPSRTQVQRESTATIRVVDVDDAVTQRLLARHSKTLFSELYPGASPDSEIIGPGDILDVSVWEAPPTVLFSSGTPGSGLLAGTTASVASTVASVTTGTTSNVTTLPQQMVSADGTIYIPFAGSITVAGKDTRQVEAEISRELQGKANNAQVLVRRVANNTAYVTVVGDVASSTRMPLTPRGERLLDALAVAGGTKEPIEKVTLQLTRAAAVHSLPLDTVIRDPRQNIQLWPGDVVTVLYQPLSFTALGATGKNDEINFEAKGISLAQALARAGSLLDTRADAQGVFIFRFESTDTVGQADASSATPDGHTPVIYRFDLKDPRAFFLAQNFPVENKDILYIANAPVAQLQKFVNLLVSTVYPIQGVITLTK